MSFPVPDPETGMELPPIAETESRRSNKLVIGGAIIGLALTLAIVGSICGSGKCNSNRGIPPAPAPETTIVAAVTPVPPTNNPSQSPSDIPSHAPSDAPSKPPSNAPSFAPSDVPSQVPTPYPTPSPSRTPSLWPTALPTRTPTAVPNAVSSAEETCDVSCYLRNLDTSAETLLMDTTVYSGLSRYSIRCDVAHDTVVPYVDFTWGEKNNRHREFNAPFWMQSNSADWIEPVAELSRQCDGGAVNVRVAIAEDCEDVLFVLLPQCEDVTTFPTLSPISSPVAQVALASVEEISATSFEGDVTASEEDNSCGRVQCSLRDLDAETEILLSEDGETEYTVGSDYLYSIRCDIDNVSHVDFYLDGEAHHREYNAPYWMKSNSANWIEPVNDLAQSACGSTKNILVTAEKNWSDCLTEAAFTLKALCQ